VVGSSAATQTPARGSAVGLVTCPEIDPPTIIRALMLVTVCPAAAVMEVADPRSGRSS
jgi:hypothetical protein